MHVFNIAIAYNVPVYGNMRVEAASLQEAVEKVRKAAQGGLSDELIWDIYDVDHGSPSAHRIVHIENEEANGTVIDIDLTYPDDPWRIMSAEEVAEVLADAEIIEEITA